MKLVFFIKSKEKCPICDGIHTEMEHADTIRRIKKQKLSAKEAAKEIALDHGEEVDKKNPKKGVKKYYAALDKMEKKLKKSSDDIILNFIRRKGGSKIKDTEIHALAKRLGMDPDKMEEKIYRLLQEQLKKSGDFTPAQEKALKHGKKAGDGRKARHKLKGKSKVSVVKQSQ